MNLYHLYLLKKDVFAWPDLYWDWLAVYALLSVAIYFCARSWLLRLWYQKRVSWIHLIVWPICILFLFSVLFIVAPSHRTPGIHPVVLLGGTTLLTACLCCFTYFECEMRGYTRQKKECSS